MFTAVTFPQVPGVLAMRSLLGPALVVFVTVSPAKAQQTPQVLVAGLKNPESVVLNEQGQMFVSVIGERDRDGDGAIVKIDGRRSCHSQPASMIRRGSSLSIDELFVADKKRVWRIDESGKAEVFAPPLVVSHSSVLLSMTWMSIWKAATCTSAIRATARGCMGRSIGLRSKGL